MLSGSLNIGFGNVKGRQGKALYWEFSSRREAGSNLTVEELLT